jgi:hypothetical protein
MAVTFTAIVFGGYIGITAGDVAMNKWLLN